MWKQLGLFIMTLVIVTNVILECELLKSVIYAAETQGIDEYDREALELEKELNEKEMKRQAILAKMDVFSDIEYAKVEKQSLLLDIYRPKNLSKDLPAIIWIHGGGFTTGDKRIDIFALEKLIMSGYVLVSIDYRLVQDSMFPAQINDCKGAIRWVRANAKQYKINQAKIGVIGESAGGYLATMVGVTGNIKKYTIGKTTMDLDGDVGGNSQYSSSAQAICDIYGLINFLDFFYQKDISDASYGVSLIGDALGDNREKYALLNPLTYISKETPPFMIIHGMMDGTVPIQQSEILDQALKKNNGTEHSFMPVKDAGHGPGILDNAKVWQEIIDFLDRNLKS